MVYREFQFSWLMAGTFISMLLLVAFLYGFQLGNIPIPLNMFWQVTGLFLLVFLLFYGMTTTVNQDEIRIAFGIGLIRKKIDLKKIKSAEPVKSPWFYGYGIRWIPNGWLYNVSGPHAVELKFHGRQSIIRIGTKSPVHLKSEIEKRLPG